MRAGSMEDTVAVPATNVPSPGQLVSVRQRRYVVTNVCESPLDGASAERAMPPRPAQHLLQLQSIDDEGLGEELSVVWEIEPGRHVFERTALPDPACGFDDPARAGSSSAGCSASTTASTS